MKGRRTILGAFTLLEVMVAVAILAIAMTAIFASEAGAIRVAARARFVTTATLLARCKMSELEEQVLREGLPAVSSNGTDECCEEGEVEGFECEWEMTRIVLPDQALSEDDPLAGAGGEEAGAGTSLTGTPDPASIMSGAAMAGGGGDMMAELALQYAFPVIKPHIEEQVRRATVTVRWHEGDEERSFDVVQYMIAEQPPAALTEAAAQAATDALSGAMGGGAGTGTGTGTGTPPGTTSGSQTR